MPSIEESILQLATRVLIKRVADAPQFDVAAFRRAMGARRLLPSFLPRGLRVERSRDPKLPGEWHTPEDVAPRRTILHLHGGYVHVLAERNGLDHQLTEAGGIFVAERLDAAPDLVGQVAQGLCSFHH